MLAVAPFFIGAVTVLQAGLNRVVAERWGLSATVVLSSAVLLLASLAFHGVVRSRPDALPPLLAGTPSLATGSWWFVVPGALGLVLIAGIPWALSRMGALQVIVGMVVAQVVVSLAWDVWVEGIAASPHRLIGAVVAVVGVALVAWR